MNPDPDKHETLEEAVARIERELAQELTGGILNPIQFFPPFVSFTMIRASSPDTTDCVRQVWEDREATPPYVHNAYVSEWTGTATSGVVTSVVREPLAPAGRPINLAVTHNLTGAPRAVVTYLSIESAKQLVNQLSHAISVAETNAVT